MAKLYHVYSKTHYKLQFKIIFEKDPVPIASAEQYHIYIIQIFIYILLRESSRKMCSKTHQIAQFKSGEYAPIPLNIVCAVIQYQLFLYKNEYFYNFFLLQNFSKKFSKTHHLKKKFSGKHAPKPL